MKQFIFEMRQSVAEYGTIVIVNAENQRQAFDKLEDKYPYFSNIDYLGQAEDVIN